MGDFSKSLDVYIDKEHIGVVSQDDRGKVRFSYNDDYDSTPLSLSMPVANEVYGHKVVYPYLMGLLPDSAEQRQALANDHNVSPNNPVALLNFVGFDCPGAVRFFPQSEAEPVPRIDGRYVPVSTEEIGAELAKIKSGKQASWQLPEEHWSLGGSQTKIALACFDGQWFRCEGDAATTHIIKPGIEWLQYEALNECICQNIATRCGVPASMTGYEVFNGVPALISGRFDRVVEGLQSVRRLHQEDFCQALGVEPDKKYAIAGGPGTGSILSLLGRSANALENKIAFTAQLFFNYLIGAPDAHGKNYSVLLEGKNVDLAPLYDCASALAYDGDAIKFKTAMTIGGERRLFHLGKGNVRRYAEQADMSERFCFQLLGDLATSILEALDEVFAQFDAFEGAQELEGRMKPRIIENCQGILRMLG